MGGRESLFGADSLGASQRTPTAVPLGMEVAMVIWPDATWDGVGLRATYWRDMVIRLRMPQNA